jgi:ankyrin repeat protein
MERLLEAGADLERWWTVAGTALCMAADRGHLEAVKLLVERGADIDNQKMRGYTPLMLAVQRRRYEVAAYLLEQGADTGRKALAPRYAEAEMGSVYVIAEEINDPIMNRVLGIEPDAGDAEPFDIGAID